MNIDELIKSSQRAQIKDIKRPRFSEETLISWTKPPSDTEETKLLNSELQDYANKGRSNGLR